MPNVKKKKTGFFKVELSFKTPPILKKYFQEIILLKVSIDESVIKTTKRMKKYLTEYKHNGKLYGCEIYANSKEEAEELLKSKRLTEKIIGHNPTVEYLFY